MPFRLEPKYGRRTKIQFVAPADMPYLMYQACIKTGVCSNTVYIQRAVCEALARDLGMDLDKLLEQLPTPRGHAAALGRTGGPVRIGPGNTIEEVR